MDRLAKFDESSVLNADWLNEAVHGFRNRSELQREARLNQGGVAAFRAYVYQHKELIPFNLNFFGRGKAEGAEEDIFQYYEPCFAPVRTGQDIHGLAQPVRRAIEWSYISQQLLENNFPLDGRPAHRERILSSQ